MAQKTQHSTRWSDLLKLVTDLDQYIHKLEQQSSPPSNTHPANTAEASPVTITNADGSTQPIDQVDSSELQEYMERAQSDEQVAAVVVDLEPEGTLLVDPSRPVFKQDPPVCHYHHLLAGGCPRPECNFSHDYRLSSDERAQLSDSVKRMPCDSVRPVSGTGVFSPSVVDEDAPQ